MAEERLMLHLAKIRTNGGTQARAVIRPEVVDEYAAEVERGVVFPPVVVFEDEADNRWLADGFHRHAAYTQAKRTAIPVDLRKGTLRDAQLHAVGANREHGLRRSNEDKRSAVELLLKDADWVKATDRWIAEQCGVSNTFVGTIRLKAAGVSCQPLTTESNGESQTPPKRKGRDGKSYAATKTVILCQRCTTLGQETPATGCTKCQAERAKAKHDAKKARKAKKAAADATPTETLDAFKNPVPKKRLAAWSDPWIQETFDTLSVCLDKLLQARMAAGMSKRAKHYPFFNSKDFIDGYGFATNYVEQLIDHLRDNRPAGVCPDCAGKGCGNCRGAGLVPRELYQALKKKAGAAK